MELNLTEIVIAGFGALVSIATLIWGGNKARRGVQNALKKDVEEQVRDLQQGMLELHTQDSARLRDEISRMDAVVKTVRENHEACETKLQEERIARLTLQEEVAAEKILRQELSFRVQTLEGQLNVPR